MTGAISTRAAPPRSKPLCRAHIPALSRQDPPPRPPRAAARRGAPCRAAFGSIAMACASTSTPGKRRELGVRGEASTDAAITAGTRQAHAIRRRDLQGPERAHPPHRIRGEAAPINLAHARIETSDDAIRTALDRRKCQRLEARDGRHGQPRAKAEPLRDRDADAHPGERAGADARGDAVELRRDAPPPRRARRR